MLRRILGVVFGSCLYRFIVAVATPTAATITSTPSATRSAPIWFRLLWSACALA